MLARARKPCLLACYISTPVHVRPAQARGVLLKLKLPCVKLPWGTIKVSYLHQSEVSETAAWQIIVTCNRGYFASDSDSPAAMHVQGDGALAACPRAYARSCTADRQVGSQVVVRRCLSAGKDRKEWEEDRGRVI